MCVRLTLRLFLFLWLPSTGKSTLLRCITGRLGAGFTQLDGSITLSDGAPDGQAICLHILPHSPVNTKVQRAAWQAFQSHIGTVPQDDVVHEDLSVQDNIEYAIRLRQPNVTDEQRLAMTAVVLRDLHLSKQARQLIPNISGGQINTSEVYYRVFLLLILDSTIVFPCFLLVAAQVSASVCRSGGIRVLLRSFSSSTNRRAVWMRLSHSR